MPFILFCNFSVSELTIVKSKKLENSKDLFKSCDKGSRSESTLNQS